MGVMYPPESEYAKERVKWEAQRTEMGPGLRPYVYRDYPMMLHRAGRPDNGLGAHIIAETVCVESENEEANFTGRGFRRTPLEAIRYLDDLQKECGDLAAELNYEQKNRLSANAGAEVEAARIAHVGVSRHMPMVPETPIKKRRTRKAKES